LLDALPCFSELSDGTGRRLERIAVERLDGVDHEHVRRRRFNLSENRFHARLGQELHRRFPDPHAPRPQRDLIERFLTRHIANGSAYGEIGDGREEQRRLADPRVTPDEHHRSGYEPAAEDAVELAETALEPLDACRFEGVEACELDSSGVLCALCTRCPAVWRRGLDDRIPRAAVRALALP